MMARLLSAMGKDLSWIDQKESEAMAKHMGKLSGSFYVANAATDTDSKGRKIIADQQFVTADQAKTVFGVGAGSALTRGALVVLLIFTCDALAERERNGFQTLLTRLKSSCGQLLSQGKVFA